MKEASGELSMTAVAVVAIGAVAVIFGTLIYPNLKTTLAHNSACAGAYGCSPGDNNNEQKCKVAAPDGNTDKCADIGASPSGTSECLITCNASKLK